MAKPKNKFQKEIVGLSKKLPKLTKTFEKLVKKSFAKYYIVKYGNSYCTECGHKIGKDNSSQVYCTECETLLEYANVYGSYQETAIHHTILVAFKGWQVVRLVYASKKIDRKGEPRYFITEVVQTWIKANGDYDVLSNKATMNYSYMDSWIFSSGLEPRTNSQLHIRRSMIDGYIYKKVSLIPNLVRNGYDINFHKDRDVSIVQSISLILSNSMAETLFKAKQYSLFARCISYRNTVEWHWKSIKIAIRNNYQVKSADIWLDYLSDLEQLEKDLLNVKYICPENLQAAHNSTSTKIRRINAAKDLEKQIEQINKDNKDYLEEKAQYFGIKMKSENITIEPLKSVKEFMDEGAILDHCVFTSSYYKERRSLILSARKDGVPIETIEISLNDMKILQARGLKNKESKYHHEIIELVNQNLNKIARV